MTDSFTTRTKPDRCVYCLKQVDAASIIDKIEVPRPDDVTICLYCAGIMVFGVDLELLPAPAEVKAEVEANPESALLLAAIEKQIATRRSWPQ